MSFIKKVTAADLELCKGTDLFLQSALWGEFKSRFGWEAKAFLIDWEFAAQDSCVRQGSSPLLALSRRLAPGFSFAYIPWGPQLPPDFPQDGRAQALAELAAKLKPFLARNAVFLRFDPPWFAEDGEAVQKENASLKAAGLRCAAAAVQAPDTVIINLCADCDEILAAMKPKWRYNINLAQKKGVKVYTSGKDSNPITALEIFYLLMRETAARDGIAIHSFDYYKTLFDIVRNKNDAAIRLYTAEHKNDTLAAVVVLFRGKWAVYLYGASSNIKRNLMAPYALQWRAMQDAKEAGCQYYDLFGIPPDDSPNHPMAGLYRFKTGFGGQIIHRPGSWDYSYKPAVYSIFKMAETLRKKIRDRNKKKSIAK